jgi:hypothetical protein
MYPKPDIKTLSIRKKNGQKIIQATFKPKINEYTREEIKKIAVELRKDLLNKGLKGEMHVSIPFPIGYRSGGWTKLREEPSLHTQKDYMQKTQKLIKDSLFSFKKIHPMQEVIIQKIVAFLNHCNIGLKTFHGSQMQNLKKNLTYK